MNRNGNETGQSADAAIALCFAFGSMAASGESKRE